jgi:hypothetical protein
MSRSDAQPHYADQEILRAIHEIRYGTVEITIHDSRVVQIAKTERIRLDTSGPTKT